jgi:hypothetical protein
MAYSSNINSTIKFLSSFTTPSTFTSLGISPVCYLPLSTNTSNIGTDGFAPVITGTVNTFSNISLRSGVVFTGNFANSIGVNFNPTSNLTMSCWYYSYSNKVGLSIHGPGITGSIISFFNTGGNPEGSGTGTGWWNIEFEPSPGGINIGSGINTGIGNSPDKAKAWNQLGLVVSTNTTTGAITSYGYLNGIFINSNLSVYSSGAPSYNALRNMNKITIGRRERSDGQQVNPWNGLFKDVMIFNKPLTTTEMLSLYTEQLYNNRI